MCSSDLGRVLEGLVIAVSNEQHAREIACVQNKKIKNCLDSVREKIAKSNSFLRLNSALSNFCENNKKIPKLEGIHLRLVETLPPPPGSISQGVMNIASQKARQLPLIALKGTHHEF